MFALLWPWISPSQENNGRGPGRLTVELKLLDQALPFCWEGPPPTAGWPNLDRKQEKTGQCTDEVTAPGGGGMPGAP